MTAGRAFARTPVDGLPPWSAITRFAGRSAAARRHVKAHTMRCFAARSKAASSTRYAPRPTVDGLWAARRLCPTSFLCNVGSRPGVEILQHGEDRLWNEPVP